MVENLSVQTQIGEETAFHLAEIFRALGDPTRLRMMCLMKDGEKNVTSLAEAVGITEAGVSHHLRNLRQLRLVRARKQGREVYYTLTDEHVNQLLAYGLDHVVTG